MTTSPGRATARRDALEREIAAALAPHLDRFYRRALPWMSDPLPLTPPMVERAWMTTVTLPTLEETGVQIDPRQVWGESIFETLDLTRTEANLQGWSTREVREQLDSQLPTAGEIARTAATSEAAQRQIDETVTSVPSSTQLHKRWISHHDARVRPTHLKANGQTVRIDEPFRVGGSLLMRPGDPTGEPEEIFGCRCVLIVL